MNKNKDVIRSKTNNSDNYNGKYRKIRFNSNDDLPLKKTLKVRNMITVVRSVSHEDNKCCLQVSLDEFLCKLKMHYFDIIDVSEGTDVNKTDDCAGVLFVITGTSLTQILGLI